MFTKKLFFPARILIYVLVVTTVIATVIGTLVLLSSIRQSQYQLYRDNNDLMTNLNSGITLLSNINNHTITTEKIDLFGNQSDSIFIKKGFWGVYAIGRITAVKETLQGNTSLSKDILFGSELMEEQKAAIYLAGGNKALSVAGKTQIIGDAYLPNGGIKSANINGVNYQGSKLLYGDKKNSTRFLPPQNESLIDTVTAYFNPVIPQTNYEQKRYSFKQATKIINAENIYLENKVLKGNLIVKADSTVIIESNNDLEDILIVASKIIVKSGFKGSLQLFATKGIEIESDVHLEYPSAVCLIKDDPMNQTIQPIVNIGKRSQVEGVIWVKEKQINRVKARVNIEEKAIINGQVLVDGFVDLKGIVYGNVSCTGFFLKTAASVYENHLFNATIDATQLNKHFLSHIIYKDAASNKIIKWLD